MAAHNVSNRYLWILGLVTGVRCAPSQGQTVKVEPHNVRNINMQSDRIGKRLTEISDRQIGQRATATGASIETNILTNYIVVDVWRVRLSFISTDRRRRQVSQLVAARQPRKVIISTTGHRSFHRRRRSSELMLVSRLSSVFLALSHSVFFGYNFGPSVVESVLEN